jgi:hypothetical protein
MKKDKYIASLVIVLIAGLLGSSLAWPEVKYEQLNEKNLLVKVKGEDWQPLTPNWENGLAIPAVRVNKAGITLDGKATELNWKRAPEIAVPMYYGNVNEALVQALYTPDDVYVKVRWRDDTEDRQHHPWVWDNGDREFVAGPQIEDSVILSFEDHCEWTPSFLSGYSFDFDGWQWLAARSDPLGQAVDIEGNVKTGDRVQKQYVPYTSRNNEIIWNMKFLLEKGEGILHANWDELDRVYLLQPVDEDVSVRSWVDGNIRKEKTQFVEVLEPPEATYYNKNKIHPQFSPLPLDGNAGEVKAKGHWENGYWTVEFQRARVTPIGGWDDTTFLRLTQFSVHIFDSVEDIDQSSESKRLFLQFID